MSKQSKRCSELKKVLDLLPLPVLWGDSPDDMGCCNIAFSRMTGIQIDELGKLSWTNCLHSREQKPVRDLLVLSAHESKEIDFPVKLKSSKKRQTDFVASLKKSQENEDIWFVFLTSETLQDGKELIVDNLIDTYTNSNSESRDITFSGSYKAVPAQVSEPGLPSQSQSGVSYDLSRIVELSADAIISFSLDGVIESWNEGARILYGYTAEEAIGQAASLIVPPQRKEETVELLEALATDKLIEDYETTRVTKDKNEVSVSLVVSPLKDETGKVIAGFSVARDITRRKKAEEALLSQAHQLAKTNTELEKFAWMAAHDLKEPIRTMTTYAHLVADELGVDPSTDIGIMLNFMTQAGVRATERIQDVLVYGSLGKRDFLLEETDMNTVVEKVTSDLRQSIADSGALIEVTSLPTLKVNRSTMMLLFQNLIANALKFSSGKPVIHISGKLQPEGAIFEVSDNGIGIDQSAGDKIFDMFSRLNPDMYPGTGIGLSICKKVVELHSGSIWFESNPDVGTTFFFTIDQTDLISQNAL